MKFINFLIILLIIFLLGAPFFIKESKLSKKHKNIEYFVISDEPRTVQVLIKGITTNPESATPQNTTKPAATPQNTTTPAVPPVPAQFGGQAGGQASGTNSAQPSTIKVRYPNPDSPEQDCSLGVCNDESKCEILTNGGLRVVSPVCIPYDQYT
tara:strand:- start:1415 stop:1876 length:462 start_codon:yes stop_codon:yes gene_type:complete